MGPAIRDTERQRVLVHLVLDGSAVQEHPVRQQAGALFTEGDPNSRRRAKHLEVERRLDLAGHQAFGAGLPGERTAVGRPPKKPALRLFGPCGRQPLQRFVENLRDLVLVAGGLHRGRLPVGSGKRRNEDTMSRPPGRVGLRSGFTAAGRAMRGQKRHHHDKEGAGPDRRLALDRGCGRPTKQRPPVASVASRTDQPESRDEQRPQ